MAFVVFMDDSDSVINEYPIDLIRYLIRPDPADPADPAGMVLRYSCVPPRRKKTIQSVKVVCAPAESVDKVFVMGLMDGNVPGREDDKVVFRLVVPQNVTVNGTWRRNISHTFHEKPIPGIGVYTMVVDYTRSKQEAQSGTQMTVKSVYFELKIRMDVDSPLKPLVDRLRDFEDLIKANAKLLKAKRARDGIESEIAETRKKLCRLEANLASEDTDVAEAQAAVDEILRN